MSSNYPTSIQSFSNPNATDLLENATAALDHDYQHTTENDTLFALQTKCGVDGSAVNSTFDFKLSAISGGQKALTSGTSTQSVTNLTLVTPVITLGGDATGDMYYRNGSGAYVRLAIGSAGQILNVTGGIPAWIANPSAANGDTTTKGVFEAATAAEVTAGTATGSTGANLAVTPDALLASSYGALGTSLDKILFGDGSDGAVVISGNTTLTRDMYYTNLTINSGVTLTTANFKIFGTGTLTNNNATNGISNVGIAGSAGGNGAGGTGATATASGSLKAAANGGSASLAGTCVGGGGGSGGGTVWISFKTIAIEGGITAQGGAGGAGSTFAGGGSGNAGNVGSNSTATLITSGSGGAGGSASTGGSAGGTITTSKQSSLSIANMIVFFDPVLSLGLMGGAGGGSGSTGTATAGGGGGGQGGIIFKMYRTLTTSGTNTVSGGAAGAAGTGGNPGTAGSSGISIAMIV